MRERLEPSLPEVAVREIRSERIEDGNLWQSQCMLSFDSSRSSWQRFLFFLPKIVDKAAKLVGEESYAFGRHIWCDRHGVVICYDMCCHVLDIRLDMF